MLSLILILLLISIVFFLTRPGDGSGRSRLRPAQREQEWEYGDVWRQERPEEGEQEDTVYVEIFRTDTGRGHDDSSLLDLVGYLGSRGIRATYDSFSLGLEPAAIKTYVLKVEQGKEQEALVLLKEKATGPA